MAKRLTDCAKWDRVWFRKLSPTYKCFWQYICDRCDFSGIWEVDFETAGHYIGETLNVDEIKNVFSKQYIELNNGSRWLLKDFIIFQYGAFNDQNKMFNPIKNNLERYGVSMGDIWGINPLKDIVKDKVKDKVKEKALFDFDIVYLNYPKKIGKKEALIHFNASVKTDQDWVDINKAVDNYNAYIQSKGIEEKYIKHASTFFNNWKDWVVMPVVREVIPDSLKKFMKKEK